jgi:hypothetical protein
MPLPTYAFDIKSQTAKKKWSEAPFAERRVKAKNVFTIERNLHFIQLVRGCIGKKLNDISDDYALLTELTNELTSKEVLFDTFKRFNLHGCCSQEIREILDVLDFYNESAAIDNKVYREYKDDLANCIESEMYDADSETDYEIRFPEESIEARANNFVNQCIFNEQRFRSYVIKKKWAKALIIKELCPNEVEVSFTDCIVDQGQGSWLNGLLSALEHDWDHEYDFDAKYTPQSFTHAAVESLSLFEKKICSKAISDKEYKSLQL